jgi:hypothetical protein
MHRILHRFRKAGRFPRVLHGSSSPYGVNFSNEAIWRTPKNVQFFGVLLVDGFTFSIAQHAVSPQAFALFHG